MSKYRRAARVDDNQNMLVKALRKVPGVTVQTGKDDLLIGYSGVTYWIEVKNPERIFNADGSLKKNALKPSQEELLDNWTGQYDVAWDLDQILKIIGVNK